jgi:arylsulfatase A-like enzyme
VTGFVHEYAHDPFLLYMPFSHVHTTAGNQPSEQYAGCMFKGKSDRGPFGDALAEVDWIVGNVFNAIAMEGLENNTVTFFTGDNGPWMVKGLSGGSEGLLTGRYSGYWNTGKGSTWEGGMHEAGFAHWPGQIDAATRSHEVTSSMDVVPTVSALIGAALPTDRVYDGRDMSDILFNTNGGKSKHAFLFMYGGCAKGGGPSAVRFGVYKAYWCTGPGLGGCKNCSSIQYNTSTPLIFNVGQDPSEAAPLEGNDAAPFQAQAVAAYTTEVATFTREQLISPPGQPDEKQPDGSYKYAICCDRSKDCDCNGKPSNLGALPGWMDTSLYQ